MPLMRCSQTRGLTVTWGLVLSVWLISSTNFLIHIVEFEEELASHGSPSTQRETMVNSFTGKKPSVLNVPGVFGIKSQDTFSHTQSPIRGQPQMQGNSSPAIATHFRANATLGSVAGIQSVMSKGKVAFMFLSVKDIDTEMAWKAFFKGADLDLYTIYAHASPTYRFPQESLFYHHQIKHRVQVLWGSVEMIQAELLLLTAALKDPLNERFVIVSDTTVPLWKFDCIYSFLMSNRMSFFESRPSLDRVDSYIFHNYTSLLTDHWRKGSQWFTLTRELASKIHENEFYYDIWYLGRNEFQLLNHRHKYSPCVADEHFIQTLTSILDMERNVFPFTLTYAVMGDKRRGVLYAVSGTTFKQMHPAHWHPILLSDFSERTMTKTYRATCSYDLSFHAKKQHHQFNIQQGRVPKSCQGPVQCSVHAPCAPCYLFARKVQGKEDVRTFVEAFQKLPT